MSSSHVLKHESGDDGEAIGSGELECKTNKAG